MIVKTETIDSRIENWINEYQPDKIVVVSSETSFKLCLPHLSIHNKIDNIIYRLPDGESAKTIDYCQDFWSAMMRNEVTRKSVIIAIGGGAVLDFAGFCASVFMRGIACIYIPTTLLSMVDGSEGGKTGINFYGTKNIIGTFTKPNAILRNVDFLSSLPQTEVLSGWAEIIKHGILQGSVIWDMVKNGIPSFDDEEYWMELVRQNIQFKKIITDADFKEKGQRKLLNLGHTIGHGLEALYFEDETMTHGKAVANGIYWETKLAMELGFTTIETLESIEKLIFPLYPRVTWNNLQVEEIGNLLLHDKKNENGWIHFTFCKTIGTAEYNIEVSKKRICDFLEKHAVDAENIADIL